MSERLHSGSHPDADSLSAFAEGALPEHERAQCLAHLAACAHCREVVYLAQEPADVTSTAPVPVRTAWWKRRAGPIPALAALAGVVLAASVGIYRVSRPVAPVTQVAAVEQPSAPPLVVPEPAAKAKPLSAPPPSKRAPTVPTLSVEKPLTAPAQPGVAPPPLFATESGVPANGFLNAPAPLPLRSAAAPVLSGITGTVKDSAGAVVRADVNLRDLSSGDARAANTDASGQFNFAGLTPGRYEMQIVAPGFASTRKEIDLPPQEIARADSVLSVGAATDTIDVTAESPLLRTEAGVAATSRAPRLNLPAVSLSRRDPSSYVLPGKMSATAAAARGSVVLATDAAGALFVSRNSGKSWKAVKGRWRGKVMQLLTPASNDAAFRLTTDSGAVWVSQDGTRWDPAIPSK